MSEGWHLLRGCRAEEIGAFLHGDHQDPHSLLGAHSHPDGGVVIRAFHPDARRIEVRFDGDAPRPMERVAREGLFALHVPDRDFPIAYRLRHGFDSGETWESEDPYRFPPTLGDLDLHLHGEGRHLDIYRVLGAQLRTCDGVRGTSFAVWAPNARRVSVVGDFCHWDGRRYPMRLMGSSGIWEIFIPGLGPGERYKYEIKTRNGDIRIKTDPFAFATEERPATAGLVYDLSRYRWGDRDYMEHRATLDLRNSPMAIYEVHLGSWMRVPEEGHQTLTYRELAPRLVAHVQDFGFTHVEILPVAEHPFDGSWGYQVTGYYAPTSRFGEPDDFRFLVDQLHQAGIGIIVDWVPAHFPKDDFGLRRFDGSALYEHEDPRLAEHKDWGTLIFNYGRHEVRNFLLANALFWLKEYHLDGLRVDAVASMLYLDYSREEGEWLPNRYGGNENLEAIAFLRELNETVYAECPGTFTAAEESTAWPSVSQPTYLGGLGFGFKWDMGWMHDTLGYFQVDPLFRKYHHNELTFSMMYKYSENFIMPLSHDEVVHGKGSLLGKMPGDYWQKMANLRLLYAYMYTHPGKKLLFMGAEYGQDAEWKFDQSLEWHQAEDLGDHLRQGLQRFFRDLGRLYQRERALWEQDADPSGFRWIDCHDHEQSVFAYLRCAKDGHHVVVVLNATPVVRHGYRVGVPGSGSYRERLNTDRAAYGGSDVSQDETVRTEPIAWHGFDRSLRLNLPPLGALVFASE